MQITNEDGPAERCSDLSREHRAAVTELGLARVREGGSVALDDATWKHRVKAYCDRNSLNYAAALAFSLTEELQRTFSL